MAESIEVSAGALRAVLVALNGSDHEVRELQALRSPLFPDNPIDELIAEFNAWADAKQASNTGEVRNG